MDTNQAHIELLEEYKALRAELLIQIDNSYKIQTIWFLITSSLLTFAITEKQPLICVLAWIFNLYFWKRYLSIASAIPKIGAYIAVFIEPKTDALLWENSVSEIDKSANESYYMQPMRPYKYSKLLFPGILIAIISVIIGLSLAYVVQFNQFSIDYLYGLILLSTIGQLIYFRKQWSYDGINEKIYWQTKWKAELERQQKLRHKS